MEWADDTAMALALADSLLTCDTLDPADLTRRFVDWWRNGTYSCTGRCVDIGITTRQALARFEETADPFSQSPEEAQAGNGLLMRLRERTSGEPIQTWTTSNMARPSNPMAAITASVVQ
jgi:ADP-ribosyl-[dinitrogen reductase] hydrolase